jgi:hypothetical protein
MTAQWPFRRRREGGRSRAFSGGRAEPQSSGPPARGRPRGRGAHPRGGSCPPTRVDAPETEARAVEIGQPGPRLRRARAASHLRCGPACLWCRPLGLCARPALGNVPGCGGWLATPAPRRGCQPRSLCPLERIMTGENNSFVHFRSRPRAPGRKSTAPRSGIGSHPRWARHPERSSPATTGSSPDSREWRDRASR